MDVEGVEKILDWLLENSQNLSEGQKKEVYDLLNSVRDQLETRSKMGLADDRNPKLSGFPSTMNRAEKEYHGHDRADNFSLKSKLDHVTNIIDKETGYINSKIDTIAKDYNEQIETLKKKVRELEIEKNQRKKEEQKVSDRDIDRIADSLKGLMNGIKESRSFPPKKNYSDPPGPSCNEVSHPIVPPAPYFSHPHIPPRFHPPASTYGPSMFPPFPPSHFGPIPPNSAQSHMNQNVYRFVGGWGSAPNSHVGRGAGHPRPRFDKPGFPHRGDEKAHTGKKYCDSFWKKIEHKYEEQRFKNEHPNSASIKPQHKTASQDEHQQTSDNFNRGKFHHANRFKNHADRGKNKRFQQFGKNRPENPDDGNDSDTSVSSHVSSTNTRKEFTHKPGPARNFKVPAKNPPVVTGKKGDSKKQNQEETIHKDTPIPGPRTTFKNFRKELASKPPQPGHSTPPTNKTSQASSSKADTSDLQKLKYPSKAEALKEGIDITKKLSPPGMCLGKKNGEPVSRIANCLKDIYDFEMKFGSCQVVRF